MKLVTLALAFLLAAGCQGAFLQADAPPSQYEHLRSLGVTYLTEAKEAIQRAITRLDDAEFKDYKVRLNLALDYVESFIKSVAEQLAPVRSGIGPQIVDFVLSTRDKVKHDLEELHKELEPKCAELRQVVKKHLEEYRTLLEPALKEYTKKNQQVVEEFKNKFEPVVQELQEKIKVNVEETKSKLTPIVEVIRNHFTKILEELKVTYGPHVQEYREQIEIVTTDLKHKYETGELREKLKQVIEELRPQFKGIVTTIEKAFT